MRITHRLMDAESVEKFYAERDGYQIYEVSEQTFVGGEPGFKLIIQIPLERYKWSVGLPKRWPLGADGQPIDLLKPFTLDSHFFLIDGKSTQFSKIREDIHCGYYDKQNCCFVITSVHGATTLLCQHYARGTHYRYNMVNLPVGNDKYYSFWGELIATEKELIRTYAKGYKDYITQRKPYLMRFLESFDTVNRLLKENHKNIIIDCETTDEKFYLRSTSALLKRKVMYGTLYTDIHCNWQQYCPIVAEYTCEEPELERLLNDANAYLEEYYREQRRLYLADLYEHDKIDWEYYYAELDKIGFAHLWMYY